MAPSPGAPDDASRTLAGRAVEGVGGPAVGRGDGLRRTHRHRARTWRAARAPVREDGEPRRKRTRRPCEHLDGPSGPRPSRPSGAPHRHAEAWTIRGTEGRSLLLGARQRGAYALRNLSRSAALVVRLTREACDEHEESRPSLRGEGRTNPLASCLRFPKLRGATREIEAQREDARTAVSQPARLVNGGARARASGVRT